MKKGGRSGLSTFSLLAVSFLTLMTSQVVTSILGQLQLAFRGSPPSAIKSVYTVVSLSSFVMSLAVGIFIRHKKRAVLFGIACFSVSGVLSAFAPNLTVLILLRMLTGVGSGVFTPLVVSMLSDFCAPSERAGRMSLHQLAAQAGSVLSSLLAGFLAMFNWRLAFLLFAFGAIPFLLVARFVQEPPSEHSAAKTGGRIRISYNVAAYALLAFLSNVVFSSSFTNLSMLAAGYGIPSAQSGAAISMAALGAMLTSTLAPGFARRFGRWSTSLLWMGIAGCFFLLGITKSVFVMGIAMFLMGVLGNANGVIINSLAVYKSNSQNSVAYTSLITASSMLGGFMCPFFFDWCGRLLGDTSIPYGFTVNAVQSLAIAAISLLYYHLCKDAYEL